MLNAETKDWSPRISDLTILLYGPPKIGKSTWCAGAKRPLFLTAKNRPIIHGKTDSIYAKDWETLLLTAKDIEAADHEFKSIIIDGVDEFYKLCADFVCKKQGVEHESDLLYGKGFTLVNTEFSRVFGKLASLEYTTIFNCAHFEKEIQTAAGAKTRMIPALPEKARGFLSKLCDIIFFCDITNVVNIYGKETSTRILRCGISDWYLAGSRLKDFPEIIRMDYESFYSRVASILCDTVYVDRGVKSSIKK